MQVGRKRPAAVTAAACIYIALAAAYVLITAWVALYIAAVVSDGSVAWQIWSEDWPRFWWCWVTLLVFSPFASVPLAILVGKGAAALLGLRAWGRSALEVASWTALSLVVGNGALVVFFNDAGDFAGPISLAGSALTVALAVPWAMGIWLLRSPAVRQAMLP